MTLTSNSERRAICRADHTHERLCQSKRSAYRNEGASQCGLTFRSSRRAPGYALRARLTPYVRPQENTHRRRRAYSSAMAPTIVRDGQFRLFFFSREEARIHVHVAHPNGEAKFWLTPDVHLAVNIGLTPTQVRQAQAVVIAHLSEIEDAWKRHFGS